MRPLRTLKGTRMHSLISKFTTHWTSGISVDIYTNCMRKHLTIPIVPVEFIYGS